MEDEVIAERTLISAGSPTVEVVVRLVRPTFNDERQDYECAYQIIGGGEDITRFAAGLDEFQALWLSFGMIAAEISVIEGKIGRELRFNGEDGWFPVLGWT